MIRVAFVLGFRDQSWLGGVSYFRNLVNAVYDLPDRRIEPVIFVNTETPAQIMEGFPPVEQIRMPLLRRWSSWWMLEKAGEYFQGRKYLLERLLLQHDISVLSHSKPLGNGSTIKTISWIPDFQHRRMPEFFSRYQCWYRDRQFISTCRGCDLLVLSSYAAQGDLAMFLPEYRKKSRVLQFVPKLEVSQAIPFEEVKRKFGIEDKFFLLPNQFWKHKNHMVVVEALRVLSRRGEEVVVLCTGNTADYRDSDYFTGLSKAVETYGLSKNFKVLGVVSYPELLSLMQQAVAIINPSLFEGWSTTVEEAKALGKQVILSDIAVHREQAPLYGTYFVPSDPVRLADILWSVWNELILDAKGRMSRAVHDTGRRRIEFAQQYQDIVLSVVHNHV